MKKIVWLEKTEKIDKFKIFEHFSEKKKKYNFQYFF